MLGIWQDIRFGVRMLLKHRLATLVCVIALGLGIGANAAMFSMAEGFLLHPVPFENSDKLVALVDSRPEQNVEMNSIAPATFFDWKKEALSFEKLTFYAWSENNLTGDREPQKIQAFLVAANFFQTICVQPQLGRSFLPEEEEIGKDQEIILGHALWEQRYASDPHIVGKTIKVDGLSVTVVGVMAKGFDFPMPAEAWMPLGLDAKARQDRTRRWLFVLGKMKDGVSFEQASAEMNAISTRQAEAYPDTNKGWTLRPMPLRQFVTGNLTRQYTILLLGAVGFVLLIACADVANVQFARITGRAGELAVRTALGGTKWRVVRQLLVESILLSLCGAALGLLFGEWGVAMILSHMPPDVAKFVAGWKTISLDSGALLFTLGVAVVSGLLSGIAPALLSSRTNINETLRKAAAAHPSAARGTACVARWWSPK